MKEELMRRISAALDSPDGLAGDPALQDELRGDVEANKYTKDVARVGKWLAVWPLPEPDDAAFEALASRIEQRLDEPLGAISDPTAAPAFDDDDALRDATAGLLQSGEYPVSDSSIVLLASDPAIPIPEALSGPLAAVSSSDAKPISPIAKVALSKARVPTIVEEASGSGSGEPLSAADLELRLAQPKKKKKKKAEGATTAGATARTKSSDRISIPTPKPTLGAPTLSPVVQLPKTEDKRPGTFWWFAAAAAVGLGMFGAATLFEGQAAPTAESPHGSTLVTSGAVMPTTPVVAAAPVAPEPLAAAPMPAEEWAPPPPATSVAAVLPPSDEPVADSVEPRRRMATGTTSAPYAPARIAEAPMHAAAGGGRTVDDLADPATSPARGSRASAGPAPRIAPPATSVAATTPAPTPRPAPTTPPATRTATSTADVASLPETPDRSTIQAVLEARTAAVAACANGAHGLADIDIVIASSGRITTATVNGSFAGTPIGSCMARAVRGATFPPFSQPRFEVTYPYHL